MSHTEHPLKDIPSSTPASTVPPDAELPSPEPESYYDRSETAALRGGEAGLARYRARMAALQSPEVFDKASGGTNGAIESDAGPTRRGRRERARQELLAAAGNISAAIVALETREDEPRVAKLYAQDARDQLWDAAIALEELAKVIDAEQKGT